MTNAHPYSQIIKAHAKNLGFDHCGIARAGFLESEAPRLETWLKRGMHGKMGYMENHFDKRLDPRLLVPGAKSVVVLLANYTPEKDLAETMPYKLAKYAYGEDYHFVLKRKLKDLLGYIQTEIGEVEGRAFVDSAPVMERAWAERAGLGWIGKNSLLLNRNMGSFFFICELILDLELEPDTPLPDYCGTCTRCIDACPTDAIPAAGVVDGSRCISYFTIELKEAIPTGMEKQFNNWMFGCDICQDVCPWNRFATPHQQPEFAPNPALAEMSTRDWEEITDEVFAKIFRKSAVKRTKAAGLRRNIAYLKKDSSDQ